MIDKKLAMTVDQAAEYTGIGRNTMRQLVEWKAMPVLRIGRKILIQTDILNRFLMANQNVNIRNKNEVQRIIGNRH